MVLGMTVPTPHPSNTSARPLNPDTDNPLPSPTARQLALVAEVLAGIGYSDDPDSTVYRAMVAAVVREHGRTLRSCIAELRDQADGFARDARVLADAALNPGDPTLPPD